MYLWFANYTTSSGIRPEILLSSNASCPLHCQSKDDGRGAFRGRKSPRHFTHLHTRTDWMTDPSQPKKLKFFLLFDRANGSTMHFVSIPIQSQWESVNGQRQWARGVSPISILHTQPKDVRVSSTSFSKEDEASYVG